MPSKKQFVKQQAEEYASGVVESAVDVFQDKNLFKQLIKNVYEWSINGKNHTEIAQYLTLSKKEFDDLQHRFPEIMGAMVKGKEFANTILSMSMYDMATGTKTTKRQVPVKEDVYEDGKKVGTKTVMVWVEEEIPPNVKFNALKFLLENQVPQVYGKMNKEKDENEYAKALMSMSDADKKALILIEKNEHIKTFSVQKKEAPIVSVQTGEQTNGEEE
jgi:phage gp29-like protein